VLALPTRQNSVTVQYETAQLGSPMQFIRLTQRLFNGRWFKALTRWLQVTARFLCSLPCSHRPASAFWTEPGASCLLKALKSCKFITPSRFGFSVQMREAFWIVNDLGAGRPQEKQHSWPVVACQPPPRLTILCEEACLCPIRGSLIQLPGDTGEDVDGPLSPSSGAHRAVQSFTGAPTYGIRIPNRNKFTAYRRTVF
jgi:hypothetical protein